MKKIIFLIVLINSLAMSSKAQDDGNYRNAVGVRLGSSVPAIKNGISFKHFFGNNAVEAILSFGDGTALCGLYEIHKPIGTANLQWFIGAGGYIGFSNKTNNIGAAGIIGLDYKFSMIPLNLSLDWKPELNLVSKIGFEATGIGFSARFTF